MTDCEFLDSCNFFNDQTTDMPHTKEYLKSLYCKGDRFTDCAIHRISTRHGTERVPRHLYPIDVYKMLDFRQIATMGGLDMVLKVIYTDGNPGKVKSSTLEGLKKAGKIIAFHCSEGWIDVRRKSRTNFNGLDRRRTNPEKFFEGLDFGGR